MIYKLDKQKGDERISTALLLAAGTGSRLFPITENSPKCLTIVSGKSILERLIDNLNKQEFKRLIIVTGHKNEHIIDFLGSRYKSINIEYIYSPLYQTTNNIYSLWMARNIIKEPFVLFESDLVLNTSLLDEMVFPDKIAVAKMQPWLNGTTVSIDSQDQITKFHEGKINNYVDVRYKTVNIYSFSLSSWQSIVERLDRYIYTGNVNCYYETVFAEMIADKSLYLESVLFDNKAWYEIDTIHDLAEAEKLFPVEINIRDGIKEIYV